MVGAAHGGRFTKVGRQDLREGNNHRKWVLLPAVADVRHEHLPLLEEIVLVDPIGFLKKHARCGSTPLSPRRWARSASRARSSTQRAGQERVAALPDELQDHLRAEEALEVNVVPRRLPVVERFDVLDRHVRLRLVADDAGDDLVLGADLRRLVVRVVEDDAVAVAEDVVADPAQDLPVAMANIGASTDFISVSPVLPSLPPWTAPRVTGPALPRPGTRPRATA